MNHEKRKTNELHSHPFNLTLYGSEELPQDFLDSLKKSGLLNPIIINPSNIIISGHRRCAGYKLLGIDEIPVEVRFYSNELEEREAIIEFNIQREKTESQKITEAAQWVLIETERAKKRQVAGGGDKKSRNAKLVGKKLSQPISKGKSRDIAAQKTGYGSGMTLSEMTKIKNAADAGDGFALELMDAVDKKEMKRHGAIKKFKSHLKERKIANERAVAQTSGKHLVLPSNIQLIHGTLLEAIMNVDNNAIHLLITDPPFHPKSLDEDNLHSKQTLLDRWNDWYQSIVPKINETSFFHFPLEKNGSKEAIAGIIKSSVVPGEGLVVDATDNSAVTGKLCKELGKKCILISNDEGDIENLREALSDWVDGKENIGNAQAEETAVTELQEEVKP